MAHNYDELAKNRSLTAKNGDSFPKLLEKMRPQLMAALPRHLSADRMTRIALTEFRRNPKLAQCDVKSVLGSIVTLAQLGLEPGVMGQAFLVPYKRTCQPITGWQGIVDLISRTGRATVWTGAVYDGDEFDYAKGDRPFITHREGDFHGQDESRITHFYAVGRVNGAEWPVIEVWTANRVRAHRDKYNKVGDDHYSHENWEMYGRKVVLLQVAKYMPKSVELQTALDIEGAVNEGRPVGTLFEGDFTVVDDAPSRQDDQPKQSAQQNPQQEKPDEPPADNAQESQSAGDDDGAPPQLNFSQACAAITRAKTVEELDVIRSQITDLNEQHQKRLTQMIGHRVSQIEGGNQDSLGLD